MSSDSSTTTTDHEEIRRWAEERGGRPAHVTGTGGGEDPGLLRIRFEGYGDDENLEDISWDEWFEKFEDQNLAIILQDTTSDGEQSTFNKLVSR